MTEDEWQTSDDVVAMLEAALPVLTRRKRRLCGVAVCRDLWDVLPPRCQRAVQTAEWYAEGLAREEEMFRANLIAEAYLDRLDARERFYRPVLLSRHEMRELGSEEPPIFPERDPVKRRALLAVEIVTDRTGPDLAALFELYPRLDLLREIIGNPLRPVAFAPAWRTSTAVGLAQAMYDSRDFAAMPILADALQDAGCEDAALLDHCRGTGPHVRGCWAVDLVLGQT